MEMPIPSVGMTAKQCLSHTQLVGVEIGAVTLGNHFSLFTKV